MDDELMQSAIDGMNIAVALGKANDEISRLQSRVAELEEQLSEWQEGHRRVMEEKCPTDEKHCGCVSGLRKRIAELESALKESREDAERNEAVLHGCGFSIEIDPEYGLYLFNHGDIQEENSQDGNIFSSKGVIYIPKPRIKYEDKMEPAEREKIEQIIVNTLLKESEIEKEEE